MRRNEDPREQVLAATPLLGGCDRRQLREIAQLCDLITFEEGRTIVRQDGAGLEAFILLEGTAVVERDGVGIAELGPGDLIGEVAIVDPGRRTATVVATSQVQALVFAASNFDRLLEVAPAIAPRMLRQMAHRLRAADERPHTPTA